MAAPVLAALGMAINRVASAATHANGILAQFGQSLVGLLTAPINAVKGFASALTPFVEKANPGAIWHLTRAMDNFMAVIGQGVTPIVQGITIYVEKMGSAMAKLMPVLQPVFDEIGQFFANMAMGGSQLVKALAPFIELLSDVLVDAIQEASRVIAFFQGVLIELLNTLASAFGLKSVRMSTNAEAKGAAVYQPSVSGVEEFARKQFEQSLMGINQNRGQGKKPEDFLQDIANKIDSGRRLVEEIRNFVRDIAKWFVENQGRIEKGANAGKDIATTPGGPGIAVGGWLGKLLIS
jgi:hypothetical protein